MVQTLPNCAYYTANFARRKPHITLPSRSMLHCAARLLAGGVAKHPILLRCWTALPEHYEETEPDFVHFGQNELPATEGEGAWAQVILGDMFGLRSPAQTHLAMIFAEIVLESGAGITIPADYEERAFYIVEGEIDLGDQDGSFTPHQLVALKPGAQVTVSAGAAAPARLMLVGGGAMDKPRHLWWNFVSSSKDRIEQAKADWLAGRFPPVPGETEFIPLPENKPTPVFYP